jgi:hypothetical protein
MDNTVQTLITDALAAAGELGLDIALIELEPQVADQRADAQLRLRFGGQEVRFLAEAKRGLRPATLGATLLQLERLGEQALLVTDYVTPPLAEELRARGVAFLDAAGNVYLNRPPILVWVKGQRPAEKPTAPLAGRAFRATGLQVVFALLCRPELAERPYREIAQLAGVAHGTVGIVMADLAEGGFIVELGQAGRRIRNIRRLLDIWVEAYARTLRPKLLLGRYRAPAGDWWQKVDVTTYQAQFGAEPAAARLDQYLRPGVATFYADKIPARLLADHRLRTDPAGDVEIRKRFWTFEPAWNHPELVPPVLIYADLLATGDARCMEAAKRIYERYLAGLFDQT